MWIQVFKNLWWFLTLHNQKIIILIWIGLPWVFWTLFLQLWIGIKSLCQLTLFWGKKFPLLEDPYFHCPVYNSFLNLLFFTSFMYTILPYFPSKISFGWGVSLCLFHCISRWLKTKHKTWNFFALLFIVITIHVVETDWALSF